MLHVVNKNVLPDKLLQLIFLLLKRVR